MSIWELILLIISGERSFATHHATPMYLKHVDEIAEVADVPGAGAQRGPRFYEYKSSGSDSESDIHFHRHSKSSAETLDTDSSRRSDKKKSTEASSFETKEKKLATRTYRECTPCPLDMIKKHTNLGIKWICGAYQRARRSFKSDCMMRYRNCQDGTLFIKVSDQRCKEDPYHGRHWFYIYRV